MLDQTQTDASILFSIINRLSGFLYRCRNDKDYSMLFMAGDVAGLTGHPATEFIGPKARSYAVQTHPEDLDRVYAAVDAALAARGNWHVGYRIQRPDGSDLWVHEIGGGVYDGADLLYLEGIVLDNDRNRRGELDNAAMLTAISDTSRQLLASTQPILPLLRTLRVLAINARLEAGRAGSFGASFGFVAQEVSTLAEETSELAQAVATAATDLQGLLARKPEAAPPAGPPPKG